MSVPTNISNTTHGRTSTRDLQVAVLGVSEASPYQSIITPSMHRSCKSLTMSITTCSKVTVAIRHAAGFDSSGIVGTKQLSGVSILGLYNHHCDYWGELFRNRMWRKGCGWCFNFLVSLLLCRLGMFRIGNLISYQCSNVFKLPTPSLNPVEMWYSRSWNVNDSMP